MSDLTVKRVTLRSRDIRQIYFDSFPKKERMPFPMMVAMSHLWNTEFLSFCSADTVVGTIYYAKNHRLVFIMFLAVDKSMRSNGFGSEILQFIRSKYPNHTILVSIEPCLDIAPDFVIRSRRKTFYLRNGFSETGYQMTLNRTKQEILVCNGAFQKRAFLLFFIVYSNGTILPKIKTLSESKRSKTNEAQRHRPS